MLFYERIGKLQIGDSVANIAARMKNGGVGWLHAAKVVGECFKIQELIEKLQK